MILSYLYRAKTFKLSLSLGTMFAIYVSVLGRNSQ